MFLNERTNKKGYSTNVLPSNNALHWTAASGKQSKINRESGWSNKISFSSLLTNATLFSYPLYFCSIRHTTHLFRFFPFQFLLTSKMDINITLFIFPQASRFISNPLLASAMIKIHKERYSFKYNFKGFQQLKQKANI